MTNDQTYTYYYNSPVGTLRIKANDEAIIDIYFLDEVDEFNSTSSQLIEQCVGELTAYFLGNLKAFSVPLVPHGSDFQVGVWQQLQNIPFGKTISYLDLAKKLGDPKVIRAAASANGKNPIPIIIPCHRVIGSNGDLVGFGGGLWRKRWLLEHEAKYAHGVQSLF